MDVVPRGLRWHEDSGVSARLRPRISRLYFCVFATAWNLALGPGHVLEALGGQARRPVVWTLSLDLVGSLGAAFFLILAAREIALTTRVTFGKGLLAIRAPLAPWVRFERPMSEITAFVVVPGDDGTYQVGVQMRTGPDCILPLGFETVRMRASWTRKRPFASPVTYATFLAGRLTEMLETARRAGHDTYRT